MNADIKRKRIIYNNERRSSSQRNFSSFFSHGLQGSPLRLSRTGSINAESINDQREEEETTFCFLFYFWSDEIPSITTGNLENLFFFFFLNGRIERQLKMVHDAVVIVSIEGDYAGTYKFPEAPPSDFTPIESIKQQQQQLIHQRGSGRGGFLCYIVSIVHYTMSTTPLTKRENVRLIHKRHPSFTNICWFFLNKQQRPDVAPEQKKHPLRKM